ncbi:MAG: helix-turn-helix transcriptional regulator [Streptococcus sp.]
MTQQELADKVFVTRQTISKWELGKSEPDNVSLELLFKEMNIEKESQKDIKANLISRKNFTYNNCRFILSIDTYY